MGTKLHVRASKVLGAMEGDSDDFAGLVALQADAAAGQLAHINVKVSASTVKTITLPTWCRYLTIISQGYLCAWALDADTPAIDAANAGTAEALTFAAAGDGTVGGIVDAGSKETRVIPCDGSTAHLLKLICATADACFWVIASGG